MQILFGTQHAKSIIPNIHPVRLWRCFLFLPSIHITCMTKQAASGYEEWPQICHRTFELGCLNDGLSFRNSRRRWSTWRAIWRSCTTVSRDGPPSTRELSNRWVTPPRPGIPFLWSPVCRGCCDLIWLITEILLCLLPDRAAAAEADPRERSERPVGGWKGCHGETGTVCVFVLCVFTSFKFMVNSIRLMQCNNLMSHSCPNNNSININYKHSYSCHYCFSVILLLLPVC